MIKPRFLYNNILRLATVTELTDWRDFTYLLKGGGSVDWTIPTEQTIDAWSVYTGWVDNTSTTATCQLQYESSPSVFTTIETIDQDDFLGLISLRTFSEVTVAAGRRIRVNFSVNGETPAYRQICVGQYLESEIGQYTDASNPRFTYGYKSTNTIAQNGSILNRSIKRIERTGVLNLQYLTEQWYRDSFEPLAQHAVRYPFIYQPDPTNYPKECAFAVAEQVTQPKRSGAGLGSRLDVNWKLRMLGPERYDV